jgi:hypothetical protein
MNRDHKNEVHVRMKAQVKRLHKGSNPGSQVLISPLIGMWPETPDWPKSHIPIIPVYQDLS